MHGRILIADDRFASRLMLSALFARAYYDVQQCDSAEDAMCQAVKDQPGIIVIADGLSGIGAAGLCDRLRNTAETSDILRIVMIDLPDPVRTAMMLNAGADDVITRSCPDEEVLLRLQKLIDLKARISTLTPRDAPLPAPPGLQEAPADFTGKATVCLVSRDTDRLASWPAAIRKGLDRQPAPRIVLATPDTIPESGTDVVVLDSGALGEDGTLRLVARMSRRADMRSQQVLVAVAPKDAALGLRALDIGADNLLSLPLVAEEAAARISLLLRRKGKISQLQARIRSGMRSALTDPLTGLYNRRYALPRLDDILRDVRANHHPAAVIMADLDHFKWINDTLGHAAGDAVLSAVSKVMKAQVGRLGFAARMGGEEFLVALPSCGRLPAAAVARRILTSVAECTTAFPDLPEGLQVTTSIGVAVADPCQMPAGLGTSEDTAALLTRADRALYRAKRAGRNRVVCDMNIVTTDPREPPQKVLGLGG